MIKINRKLEYALIALKHLNQKVINASRDPSGHPVVVVSAKEIAETYGASFDLISRVLQVLVRIKVLRSSQGAQGGYSLDVSLEKLTMLELVEGIMGPLTIAKCLHVPTRCDLEAKCNIVFPIHHLNSRLIDFYRSIPVADLLVEGRSQEVVLMEAAL